jgi:hypothetical protein
MPLNVDKISTGFLSVNGTEINKNGGLPYKVYTALLTQSGGSDFQNVNSGPLIKGVSYNGAALFCMIPFEPYDFSNVGGPKYPESFSFVATSSDVPNSYGSCTIQYNTGAPVVTVLENTIGDIWFTYNAVGQYKINSNTLFTPNKTFLLNGTSLGATMFNKMIPSDGSGILNNVGYVITYDGINRIAINSFIDNEIYGNDVLDGLVPIEIRVYN